MGAAKKFFQNLHSAQTRAEKREIQKAAAKENSVVLAPRIVVEDGVAQVSFKVGKKNGKMLTGLYAIKGKKFFFSKQGILITGWVKINGNMYYFTQKGGMQKKKKIGKYQLGPDGICTNWGKAK